MPRVIGISRMSVSEGKFAQIEQLWHDSKSIHASLAGCLSYSVWRDLDLSERYAVLTEFASEESLEGVITKLESSGVAERLTNLLDTPPDMRQIRVDTHQGKGLGELKGGDMMSMSIRSSEPGFGNELERETKQIFDSLQFISGYLGAIIGPNINLPEEVFGLAFWESREAFEESLPAKSLYEVKLYGWIL